MLTVSLTVAFSGARLAARPLQRVVGRHRSHRQLPVQAKSRRTTKGSPDIATRELKEFWHKFFISEEYREKAKQRILDGSAPHLENYLLNRIYGKPREQVDLNISHSTEDLSSLTIEELRERAEQMVNQLAEAKALEEALPAEFREGASHELHEVPAVGGDRVEASSPT